MRVVVRADSAKHIGFGHITRSLTLAQGMTKLGADVLSTGQGMARGRTVATSFADLDVSEAPISSGASAAENVLRLKPDGVVVDGYHFEPQFFDTLSSAGVPYGVIDDNGETRAIAPKVIHNQNPSARRELYRDVEGKPRFLLGLDFCLLRPEITELAGQRGKKEGYIFVSFGGTDSMNLTKPVVESLIQSGHNIATSEKFREILRDHEAGLNGSGSVLYFKPSHFAESLSAARLAILGAGTSLWEASALGVMAIGVIVAENQLAPAHKSLEMGVTARLVQAMGSRKQEETVSLIATAVDELGADPLAGPGFVVPHDGATRAAGVFLEEFSRH